MNRYLVLLSYNPAMRGLPSQSAITLWADTPQDAAIGAGFLANQRVSVTYLPCCIHSVSPSEVTYSMNGSHLNSLLG